MKSSGGGGMSRAAKKKRKVQQKLNQGQLSGLLMQEDANTEADDPQSEQQDSSDDEADENHATRARKTPSRENHGTFPLAQSSGKGKGNKWRIFEHAEVNHPLLAQVNTLTLPKILALEDVVDTLSAEKAALLLSKIVYPMPREEFFHSHWERKPARFDHHENASFFGKIFSKKTFKTFLTEHVLKTGIDVELFRADGDLVVAEEPQALDGSKLWVKFAKHSHAVRLLQPQVSDDLLWNLCASLEHEFGCRVNVSVLLQPAAHSLVLNDSDSTSSVDRFVLQLEGSQEYALREETAAARGDDLQNEEQAAETCFTLAAGDSLYVPSGFTVRVANVVTESSPSGSEGSALSLMLGTSGNNSVHKFMGLLLPQAIENLAAENRLFRRQLPSRLNDALGIAMSECDEDVRRQQVLQDVNKLLANVLAQAMDIVDPAHDQLSKQLILERLPPVLSDAEERQSAAGAPNATIHAFSQLRMLRPGLAIAAVEQGKVVIYHAMDNSRELFGSPVSPLEFDLDDGPAIEALLRAYPQAVTVSDIEHSSEDVEDKIGVAEALYREGLLMIVDEASKPVGPADSDDDSDCPF